MSYKYDSPHDWFLKAARDWSEGRLYQEVCNLARLLDSDTLQDEYQSEMEANGYFAEQEE